MDTPRTETELHDLFARLCAGRADRHEQAWLENELQQNGSIRRLWLEFTALDSQMARSLVAEPEQDADEKPILIDYQSVFDREPALAAAGESTAQNWSPRSETVARAIDWRRHPIRFLATAAALTVALWAGWMSLVLPPHNQRAEGKQRSIATAPKFVAQLLRSANTKWSEGGGLFRDEAYLRLGQVLDLESGLAELQFQSGAVVTLRGPASLKLTGTNAAELTAGSLLAKVPAAAIGFTVVAPTVTLTDLGTEFGLEIDTQGHTDVVVLDGEVEAAFHPVDGAITSVQRLVAGESVRVQSGSGAVAATKAKATKFAREMTMPARIAVVSYSYDGTPEHCLPESAPQKTVWPDTLSEGQELTNGVIASAPFADPQWVGFYNLKDDGLPQPLLTFDLGKQYQLQDVQIVYLHSAGVPQVQAGGSVTAPEEVYLSISKDGTTFSEPLRCTPFNSSPGNSVRIAKLDLSGQSGRYVRLDFRQTSQWTFLSEVQFSGVAAEENSPANEEPDSSQ